MSVEVERVAVAQELLDEVQERLARVRWADEIPGTDWEYGVPVGLVREQVAYWREHYDWRRWESRLNAFPQYGTEIGGQRVHFLHVRSPRPGAMPLILTHGWPGSVFEFLDLIEPLTELGFHLVVPSLPGFTFSGPTRERGWDLDRIAGAWHTLMQRLGYERFGAVGNDWGSSVTLALGRRFPADVIGMHVTQVFAEPEPGEQFDDPGVVADRKWYHENMSAYDVLQSQQPQTLAHALADSPAGLLGWMNVVYRGWNDLDFVLTNVMAYWLTGTVASSMRLYYEASRTGRRLRTGDVPLAVAQFANDYRTIRSLAERDHPGLTRWTEFATGNHFAAHSAPDDLIGDLSAFFGKL
ncbi:pimeloyl-ACP methyl ester carboxylesterase [Kribbella voronezhensis]|uniref:Pimeloyl-ACP methyl ester carboxylesterase n=1 Tax=Kribbella voronezhensis TaxID=2512212 RepID=A0A4V3FJZ6_9ACTN|nr:epoxide hydrolase family protein [Kribbella voronezhensis]TDU88213.1 pimeloyl-ACP methyl ester carboxylesterase [Kribbella voronezhensis]